MTADELKGAYRLIFELMTEADEDGESYLTDAGRFHVWAFLAGAFAEHEADELSTEAAAFLRKEQNPA